MPYACSNNGLTRQWHDPAENYQPKAGETLLPNDLQATIVAAFPGYLAALAVAQQPAPPVLDASTLATALVAKGVITQAALQAEQPQPPIAITPAPVVVGP